MKLLSHRSLRVRWAATALVATLLGCDNARDPSIDQLQSSLSGQADRIAKLEAALDAVQRVVNELRAAGNLARVESHAPATSTNGAQPSDGSRVDAGKVAEDVAELGERLALLEELAQTLTEQLAANRSQPPGAVTPPPTAEQMLEVFADRERPEADRIRVAKQFRSQAAELDEEQRRLVTAELLAWLGDSDNAEMRAFIVRNLHGVKVSDIKGPLIGLLRSDADARVREEAAETLDDYLDDPLVKSALERAATDDADGAVRRQAAAALIKSALGG
ncbi:MAG: HEAT repeat domain-containing protein [Planctomycetota bacterium]